MRPIRRWAFGLLIILAGCAAQPGASPGSADPIGTALAGRPTEPAGAASTPTADGRLDPGDQARVAERGAPDLWDAPSGGGKVYERPKLHGGSLVTVEAFDEPTGAVRIRTEEGVVGWMRPPSAESLIVDLPRTGPELGVQPGARVRIVRKAGVPLRAESRSTSAELRKNLPGGTEALVLEQLGDWLRVRLDDQAEGWVRWYYDGEFVIEPLP
ncbi:MAG TPA: SH3 domain-containing protein [Herpetosiphonaceae bacterium]